MSDYGKNLRVALIVPVAAPDGDTRERWFARHRYNLEQARALGEAGATVELYADAPEPAIEAIGPRATLHLQPCARGIPTGVQLIAAARMRGADVVHLFHLLDSKASAWAALGGAKVYAEYNGGAPPSSRARRLLLRAATSRLDGVFFTARELAEPFKRALSPAVAVHAVPELSSLLEAKPTPRADLSFLAVTRFSPEKDPHTLLAAFEAIRRERPEARLIIAAGASEPPRAPEGVEIRTQLSASEMPALYASATVMLHTSRRETCGAAFIEALQAGLPIAASDIPAFRALGRTPAVELCPPGDAAAFARAALRLANDPRAPSAARERFEAALSYRAIARRKLAIYRGEDVPLDY